MLRWRLLLRRNWLRIGLRHMCWRLRRRRLRWVSGVIYGWTSNMLRLLLHGRRLRDGGRSCGGCLDERAEGLGVHELQEKEGLEDGICQLWRLS